MRKGICCLAAIGLAVAAAALATPEIASAGPGTGTVKVNDGGASLKFVFKVDGKRVKGTFKTRGSSSYDDYTSFTVPAGRVSWVAKGSVVQSGDGTFNLAPGGTATIRCVSNSSGRLICGED